MEAPGGVGLFLTSEVPLYGVFANTVHACVQPIPCAMRTLLHRPVTYRKTRERAGCSPQCDKRTRWKLTVAWAISLSSRVPTPFAAPPPRIRGAHLFLNNRHGAAFRVVHLPTPTRKAGRHPPSPPPPPRQSLRLTRPPLPRLTRLRTSSCRAKAPKARTLAFSRLGSRRVRERACHALANQSEGLAGGARGRGGVATSLAGGGGQVACHALPNHALHLLLRLPLVLHLLWGLGFRVWGLGFRVWGVGFRVWGLGFRVWGLGFRV